MGQKDMALKALFSRDDVFADTINGLLFEGRKIIQTEDLLKTDTETQYAGENRKLHEQRRDVSRWLRKSGRITARISMENQTDVLWYMPARLIGYDGASYAEQFTREEMKKNHTSVHNPGHISVTLVLYYGMKPWNYSRSLKEVMRGDEELRKYSPDYHMNLYSIAFLKKEEVEKFQSDFRILADYLVQMRTKGKYELSAYPIRHVQETLAVMNAFTGKDWFSEEVNAMMKAGKEISMVSAYAEVRKEARAEGMAAGIDIGRNEGIGIGRSEGETRGRISVYYEEMKMSPEEIAKKMNEPLDQVLAVIDTLKS